MDIGLVPVTLSPITQVAMVDCRFYHFLSRPVDKNAHEDNIVGYSVHGNERGDMSGYGGYDGD